MVPIRDLVSTWIMVCVRRRIWVHAPIVTRDNVSMGTKDIASIPIRGRATSRMLGRVPFVTRAFARTEIRADVSMGMLDRVFTVIRDRVRDMMVRVPSATRVHVPLVMRVIA